MYRRSSTRRRRALVEELEPRLLFSADAAELVGAPGLGANAPQPPALELVVADAGGPSVASVRRELVVIDAGVAHPDALLDDLRSRGEAELAVVVLSADRDGVTQLSETLAGYRGELDAVHVVSHATSDGSVRLGDTQLELASLDAHAGAVAGWGVALANGADLLFYGCDLAAGADGRALLDALHELTGADVAASVDDTGHAELGGDWDLEWRRGDVDSDVPFSIAARQGWRGLLAPPVANDDVYSVAQNQTFESSDTWLHPDWEVRRRLSFDNSAQTEDLDRFPVLVVLDATRIDYAKVQDAGQDLRFTDGDGTLLAHEIDSWDETGTSYVWVKVSRVDGASASDFIWMYHGNAGAADGQDPGAVWSQGYQGVYHLDEDPGSAPGGVVSATGAFHATNMGTSDAAGRLAGAQSFDPLGSEHISLGSDVSLLRDTDSATISAWIRTNDRTGSKDVLSISRGSGATVQSRASFYVSNGQIGVFARTVDDDSDFQWRLSTTTPISDNTWHNVTVVIDYAGDDLRVFVDGVAQPMGLPVSFAGPTADSNASHASIGAQDDGSSSYWNGEIDEVRVADIARSDDWVAAQHLSMTDAFVSVGREQYVAGVLENDIDPDGDGMTVNLVLGPSHAAEFRLNPDGSFLYKPEAVWTGIDSFTYIASDGGLDSTVATVTLEVAPPGQLDASWLVGDPPPLPEPPPEPSVEPPPDEDAPNPEAPEPRPDPGGGSGSVPLLPDVAAPVPEPPAPTLVGTAAPAGPEAVLVAPLPAPEPAQREATVAYAGLGDSAWEALRGMSREMGEGSGQNALASFAMKGASVATMAGFLSWVLRAGTLAGGIASSLPLWARFDPLPVLDRPKAALAREQEEEEEEEDEAERAAAALLG